MVDVLIITICTAQHQARSALGFGVLIEQRSEIALRKTFSEALSTFYAEKLEMPSASGEAVTVA